MYTYIVERTLEKFQFLQGKILGKKTGKMGKSLGKYLKKQILPKSKTLKNQERIVFVFPPHVPA